MPSKQVSSERASTKEAFRLDLTAIGGSFAIGLLFVVLFTWMNGNAFAAAPFPLFGMTAGFVLAGAGYGY